MIKQLHQKLVNQEITSRQLTEDYLKVIAKKEPKLNAFITVNSEQALQQADEVDESIKKGQSVSLLAGIPMAIKDVICAKGIKTTAASKILANFIPTYDATVVSKLKKAGAVILGKTNQDEFAMGSSGENSSFGPTKNPLDLERVPGGSSSGSAVSVASGEAVYALGSDTGGSIRQPASFCGLVGLKPTYGLVSRYGLIAMASSLDQIGSLTKTVTDAAIVFNFISGRDPKDATSLDIPKTDYLKNLDQEVKGLIIGLPKEFKSSQIDEEVAYAWQMSVEKLKSIGVKFKEVSLPSLEFALAIYYIIMPAEVSANLARFDGLRFGKSFLRDEPSSLQWPLSEIYLKNRASGFGKEAKRRIILGNFVLSAGFSQAFYQKAQIARERLRQDLTAIFKEVDCLLGPTSPILPFKLGEKIQNPLTMYLADIFTVPVNLAGLPAISVPAKTKSNLPIGLQIIGPSFSEDLILRLAYNYEKS